MLQHVRARALQIVAMYAVMFTDIVVLFAEHESQTIVTTCGVMNNAAKFTSDNFPHSCFEQCGFHECSAPPNLVMISAAYNADVVIACGDQSLRLTCAVLRTGAPRRVSDHVLNMGAPCCVFKSVLNTGASRCASGYVLNTGAPRCVFHHTMLNLFVYSQCRSRVPLRSPSDRSLRRSVVTLRPPVDRLRLSRRTIIR